MSLAVFDLSIVIPAYNEAERISHTLLAIQAYFTGRQPEISLEIIVIDDGSLDQTAALVTKLEIPEVSVISYPHNQGKGYAVRQGVLASRGKYILLVDADLSTPMACFDDLWSSRGDYSIVIGSRGLSRSQVSNHWYRVWLGKMGNKLIRLLIPGISDTQCGFKLFEGELARSLFAQQRLNGFGFDFEVLFMAHASGTSLLEVPVIWVNAEGSKVRPQHYVATLWELGQVWINHRKGRYQYGFTRSKLHQ